MKNLLFFFSLVFLFSCQSSTESSADKLGQNLLSDSLVENTEQDDSALIHINQSIRSDINNPELYLKRAVIYKELGDKKASHQDLLRAYEIDSTNLNTLLARADYFMNQGRLSKSLEFLGKAKSLYPESSEVYLRLGELFLIGKNNKKSLENADLAVKYDMHNAKAYYLKGFNFLSLKDTTSAISSFRTAVEQNPDHFESYMQLGLIFSLREDPLAISYFNNALEVKPHNKDAMYSKAMFQQENDMYNEAMTTYHELIKAHPDFREAYYNLGYVHMYYLKLYRQATLHFTDAIEVDPTYYQAYYNRGYSFELLGDVTNAAKDYRKALSIKPDYDLAAKGLSRVNEGL